MVTIWVKARIAIFLFVTQCTNKLSLLTIQKSILKDLHNANYFNYQVPVIITKKKTSHSVQVNHAKYFPGLFKDFPGCSNPV